MMSPTHPRTRSYAIFAAWESFISKAMFRIRSQSFSFSHNVTNAASEDVTPDFDEVDFSTRAALRRRHQSWRSASHRARALPLTSAMSSGATSPRSISLRPIRISRRNCWWRIFDTSSDSLNHVANSLRSSAGRVAAAALIS